MPRNEDPNLLVGFETSDDAAVYRLNESTALVTTADLITPPVDDAHLFGQIAAANALSDVYAMGGKPLVCLTIVGFPEGKLDDSILHQMVAGALTKITEAGAVLGGGHTTEDEEPKLGLSVTGIVDPDRVWTNAGAQEGDALILTKPIGSGVLFNANLKGWISTQAMEKCIETLITLNKSAAETLKSFEVHAVTDVTGFGLAGHGLEMARASGLTLRFELDAVPLMDEALDAYRRGMSTGVNAANRRRVQDSLRFERQLPEWHQEIVVDPQTSGGLLVALPQYQADAAVEALKAAGCEHVARIGSVEAAGSHRLIFV